MKKISNFKILLALLVSLSFSNIFADPPSGCMALANSKWFGRVLGWTFNGYHTLPVNITLNINDVVRKGVDRNVYVYHVSGTLNQLSINGSCFDDMNTGMITIATFVQEIPGGKNYIFTSYYTSIHPSMITIVPLGLNWFINGALYMNRNAGILYKQ